jgi:hypothetical protein
VSSPATYVETERNVERLLMVEEGYLSESQGILSCITTPEPENKKPEIK